MWGYSLHLQVRVVGLLAFICRSVMWGYSLHLQVRVVELLAFICRSV